MKNKWILFLATMFMVLPSSGKVFAQAALTSYECDLEPMRAHVFSASAQTFTFGDYSTGDNISHAWLKSDGGYGVLPGATYGSTPPSVSGNIALPGDGFYFGEKKMKYIGITGGGLVYFGETDELHPTYNPYALFLSKGSIKNILYTNFSNTSGTRADLCKTENTSVQYEIVADTLFIAYNNVKAYDETFSFQYAFTKDGAVSLIPVNIQPQKACRFSCGLYLETPAKSASGCFLKNLEGEVQTAGSPSVEIDPTNYPTQTYCFHGPAPCVAIENPSVEWDYVAGMDYIELCNRRMTCNGNACVFIISESASLSGANLPQDGTIYKSGDIIGSASNFVFVGTTEFDETLYFRDNNYIAENLKPATTYYIHAFPYNDDCSGVRYNTTNIVTRVVSTALAPINSISVDATSITDNGFTLNIDKGNAACYTLAVSRRQINPGAVLTFPIKEGGYSVGDRVRFRYKSAEFDEFYDLEILAAAGTDAQYQVTDAEPNSDYYYYAWATNAAQDKFSITRRTCGGSTLYHTTAVFAFDSAAADQREVKDAVPSGWETKGFFVSYVPNEKFLSTDLLPLTGVIRSSAISPTMQGGKSVAITVDFIFCNLGETGVSNRRLREGDAVYVQWKLVSEENWTTLNTLDEKNSKAGENTVTTDYFFPSGNFNVRIVAEATKIITQEEVWASVGIRKITVGSVCNPISSTPEASQIMNDRATLSWEDADNTPQASSYHLRYRLSENEDWTGKIAKTRQFAFTGLQPNTLYNMEVAAVCAPGDTSDYVSSESFTTLRGLPYEFVADAESGVTFKTGVLPASGTATLTAPDADKAVWAPMEKGSDTYAGLEVSASLNNPLWFNLPVLSTGSSKGEARLSLQLSAWDATGHQQATFGENDTLLVLFSTDNAFSLANKKLQIDLSQVTPEGKMFNIDFEVKEPYQYWALYTNLQTEGNVLFIDSLIVDWLDVKCNAVTNVSHSNVGYYSIDITWKGEGMEYGIFYNDRKTDKWDSVFITETTYTLEGLTSETNYQYYIVTYCDAEHLKASDRSSVRYFNTKKVCEVPTLEILEGSETWQGVTVITHSNEQNRQFYIRAKDIDWAGTATNRQKDTTDISGLKYIWDFNNGVTYYIQVRAICPNDSSAYSEAEAFTTLPTPDCDKPVNLKASVDAATQVATLSWEAGTNNIAYAVFVRAGGSRQDTITTRRTSFNTRVEPDVVYTWSMMATCEDPLYSDIVNGPMFKANSVGVESVQSFDKAVKVRVLENQILIENNEGLYIKSLQAFSVDGKLLRTYSVNSTQNAYIYHTLPKGAALLRVLGENGKTATYKTIIL